MILYDNVCTPCVRKQEWRWLRNFARKHKQELTRVDVKKQPLAMKDIWWDTDVIPLPVVVFEVNGAPSAVNLNEFIRTEDV